MLGEFEILSLFPQSINNAGVKVKMVWCVENVVIDIADIFERVNMSAKTYLIRKYSKILIILLQILVRSVKIMNKTQHLMR